MKELIEILESLKNEQQNLMAKLKNEDETKKIKHLEKDLHVINAIIKAIISYQNYCKLRDMKKDH